MIELECKRCELILNELGKKIRFIKILRSIMKNDAIKKKRDAIKIQQLETLVEKYEQQLNDEYNYSGSIEELMVSGE